MQLLAFVHTLSWSLTLPPSLLPSLLPSPLLCPPLPSPPLPPSLLPPPLSPPLPSPLSPPLSSPPLPSSLLPSPPSLLPSPLSSPDSGVGAGIDSYYEYCLKSYILLGDTEYLHRFNKVLSPYLPHSLPRSLLTFLPPSHSSSSLSLLFLFIPRPSYPSLLRSSLSHPLPPPPPPPSPHPLSSVLSHPTLAPFTSPALYCY